MSHLQHSQSTNHSPLGIATGGVETTPMFHQLQEYYGILNERHAQRLLALMKKTDESRRILSKYKSEEEAILQHQRKENPCLSTCGVNKNEKRHSPDLTSFRASSFSTSSSTSFSSLTKCGSVTFSTVAPLSYKKIDDCQYIRIDSFDVPHQNEACATTIVSRSSSARGCQEDHAIEKSYLQFEEEEEEEDISRGIDNVAGDIEPANMYSGFSRAEDDDCYCPKRRKVSNCSYVPEWSKKGEEQWQFRTGREASPRRSYSPDIPILQDADIKEYSYQHEYELVSRYLLD